MWDLDQGRWWAKNASSDGWGSEPGDICSNAEGTLPRNSRFLLCPTPSYIWGTQYKFFYEPNNVYQFESGHIGESTFWWYKITNLSPEVSSILVNNFTLGDFTDAEFYTENPTTVFKYWLSLSDGHKGAVVTMGMNDSVYILVIDRNGTGQVSFTAKALNSPGMSTSTTILIVLWSIALLLTIGCLISYFIKKRRKKEQKERGRNQVFVRNIAINESNFLSESSNVTSPKRQSTSEYEPLIRRVG